jgi:hypothetical protein
MTTPGREKLRGRREEEKARAPRGDRAVLQPPQLEWRTGSIVARGGKGKK